MTALQILEKIKNQFPQSDPDHELYDTGINGGDAVDFIDQIMPMILECLNSPPPKIAVVLEGGLVQDIVSDRPNDVQPLTFMVIDYDTEGAEDDEKVTVEGPDETAEACSRFIGLDEAVIDLQAVSEQLEAR